jgi:peptidyl-dipeptidase Dcp
MELMMSVWEPAVAQVQKMLQPCKKLWRILKFLLGIIVIIRRKFEKKIRSGPECGEGIPAIGKLRKVCFGLLVNCLICNSSRLLMFLYHADVRVWEVSNKTTGKLVGLWYFDPYARKGNVLALG